MTYCLWSSLALRRPRMSVFPPAGLTIFLADWVTVSLRVLFLEAFSERGSSVSALIEEGDMFDVQVWGDGKVFAPF